MSEKNVKPGVTNASAVGSDTATAKDRRRHPRTPVSGNAPATIRKAGAEPVTVTLRDISRSGVGLNAPGALAVGERVELTFELPGKPPLRATCRVASCRPEADGRFVVGMEFVEIARPEQAAAAPVDPKRKARR